MEISKRVEKFIQDCTKNCSNLMQVPTLDDKGNIVPEAQPWLTPDQARKAVEIAREEVIEKVCEFLDDDLCFYIKAQDFSIEHQRLKNDLKNCLKK